MGRVGDDKAAVLEVRGEHTVVSGEMGAGARHEGGEAGDRVHRVEHDMSRPVVEGVLELIHDLLAVIDREALRPPPGSGLPARQRPDAITAMVAPGIATTDISRESPRHTAPDRR